MSVSLLLICAAGIAEQNCRSRGCVNHALVEDGETQIIDLTRATDKKLRYFDVVHP